MRIRTLLLAAIAIATVLPANAIPIFARKYNLPCSSCHTGDFKLNPFGAQVEMNGYQMPGTMETTPIWNQTTPPFTLFLQPRATFINATSTPKNTSIPDSSVGSFNWMTAAIVSGGVLAPHLSYMAEYDVETNGAELMTALEYAFVNLNNLQTLFGWETGKLGMRFGKQRVEAPIEMMPEFYSRRFSQYLIYSYPLLQTDRVQSWWLTIPQYGAAVQGSLAFIPTEPTFYAAMLLGDRGDFGFDAGHVFYGRMTFNLPSTMLPWTVGVTGLGGKQTRYGTGNDTLMNAVSGFGVDLVASIPSVAPLTFYGQYMMFDQTNIKRGSVPNAPQTASGGYAELNYVIQPQTWTVQGRFDFLNQENSIPQGVGQPDDKESVNITQLTFIGRYFFMPNANIFLEANMQTTDEKVHTNSATASRSTLVGSVGVFLGI
jgi:hypothetical protein